MQPLPCLNSSFKRTEWFNGQLVKTKLSQLKYNQCRYQNIIKGFLLLRKCPVQIQYCTHTLNQAAVGETTPRRPTCGQADDFLLISCFCWEEGPQLPLEECGSPLNTAKLEHAFEKLTTVWSDFDHHTAEIIKKSYLCPEVLYNKNYTFHATVP